MIRSTSRVPRCQARNSSRRRRWSRPWLDRVVPVIRVNAKSPDGPGEADIARASVNVSVSCATFATIPTRPIGNCVMNEQDPPPGFAPLFRTSPFLETTGPFFYRKEPQGGFVIGLRVLGKHANARGSAHGGL